MLAKPLNLPLISLSLTKTGKDYMRSTGLDKVPRVLCPHGLSKSECEICRSEKVFKSRQRKVLEKEARKKLIKEEKTLILNRLKSIEQQKKAIHDAQRMKQERHEAAEAAALLHGGLVAEGSKQQYDSEQY